MKQRSNRFWLWLLGALMVLSGAIAFWVFTRTAAGTTAVVTLDGREVCRVDLATLTEGYTVSYTGEGGITNVVEFAPGGVRVREADCPDQVCVRQGWIKTGVAPIVCLPNRLTIKITDGQPGQLDGLVR